MARRIVCMASEVLVRLFLVQGFLAQGLKNEEICFILCRFIQNNHQRFFIFSVSPYRRFLCFRAGVFHVLDCKYYVSLQMDDRACVESIKPCGKRRRQTLFRGQVRKSSVCFWDGCILLVCIAWGRRGRNPIIKLLIQHPKNWLIIASANRIQAARLHMLTMPMFIFCKI